MIIGLFHNNNNKIITDLYSAFGSKDTAPSPDSLARFRGPTSKEEGKGGEGEGRIWEGSTPNVLLK